MAILDFFYQETGTNKIHFQLFKFLNGIFVNCKKHLEFSIPHLFKVIFSINCIPYALFAPNIPLYEMLKCFWTGWILNSLSPCTFPRNFRLLFAQTQTVHCSQMAFKFCVESRFFKVLRTKKERNAFAYSVDVIFDWAHKAV